MDGHTDLRIYSAAYCKYKLERYDKVNDEQDSSKDLS